MPLLNSWAWGGSRLIARMLAWRTPAICEFSSVLRCPHFVTRRTSNGKQHHIAGRLLVTLSSQAWAISSAAPIADRASIGSSWPDLAFGGPVVNGGPTRYPSIHKDRRSLNLIATATSVSHAKFLPPRLPSPNGGSYGAEGESLLTKRVGCYSSGGKATKCGLRCRRGCPWRRRASLSKRGIRHFRAIGLPVTYGSLVSPHCFGAIRHDI